MYHAIHRSDLVSIILDAAEYADLDIESIKALRQAGERIPRVAFGSYYNDAKQCGCPATEAGLTHRNGTTTLLGMRYKVDDFIDRFDNEIVDRFCPLWMNSIGYFEVVG